MLAMFLLAGPNPCLARVSANSDEAVLLIKKYWHDCDGGEKSQGNPDLDLLDASTLPDDYVVKGDAESS